MNLKKFKGLALAAVVLVAIAGMAFAVIPGTAVSVSVNLQEPTSSHTFGDARVVSMGMAQTTTLSYDAVSLEFVLSGSKTPVNASASKYSAADPLKTANVAVFSFSVTPGHAGAWNYEAFAQVSSTSPVFTSVEHVPLRISAEPKFTPAPGDLGTVNSTTAKEIVVSNGIAAAFVSLDVTLADGTTPVANHKSDYVEVVVSKDAKNVKINWLKAPDADKSYTLVVTTTTSADVVSNSYSSLTTAKTYTFKVLSSTTKETGKVVETPKEVAAANPSAYTPTVASMEAATSVTVVSAAVAVMPKGITDILSAIGFKVDGTKYVATPTALNAAATAAALGSDKIKTGTTYNWTPFYIDVPSDKKLVLFTQQFNMLAPFDVSRLRMVKVTKTSGTFYAMTQPATGLALADGQFIVTKAGARPTVNAAGDAVAGTYDVTVAVLDDSPHGIDLEGVAALKVFDPADLVELTEGGGPNYAPSSSGCSTFAFAPLLLLFLAPLALRKKD